MADLTAEETADIAKINSFRKPHTLAKFDLEGKSEAVIAAAAAKKAEFEAAGTIDDGTDEEEDGLLVMVKTGCADIRVHPTQVATWQSQGWAVVE